MKTNDKVIMFAKSDLTLLPRGAKATFDIFYAVGCLPAVESVIQKAHMVSYDDVNGHAFNFSVNSLSGDEKRFANWE